MKIPMMMLALGVAAPAFGQSAVPDVLGLPATAVPAGLVEARFGEAVPVLGCAALRACRVELEAGEKLLSPPALGDTERWLTAEISSGPGGLVPVVVVKPTACGISTNLMIATDRRIYDLDLEAMSCKATARPEARAIRFTYPNDSWTASALAEPEPTATFAERAASAAHLGYRWKRRGGFPWEPKRIADDGEHVYLELPPEAGLNAAPLLYSLDSGERTLLNHATEDRLVVTDRLFNRAVFVIGEASLEIERKGRGRRLVLGRTGAVALSAFGGLAAGLLIAR